MTRIFAGVIALLVLGALLLPAASLAEPEKGHVKPTPAPTAEPTSTPSPSPVVDPTPPSTKAPTPRPTRSPTATLDPCPQTIATQDPHGHCPLGPSNEPTLPPTAMSSTAGGSGGSLWLLLALAGMLATAAAVVAVNRPHRTRRAG